MSTNTARPSACRAASRAAVNGSLPSAALAGATGATSPDKPGTSAAVASTAMTVTACATRRPRPWLCPASPSDQPPNPSSRMPPAVASTPLGPASWLTTQTSHTAAPYIGNASACLTTSIQRPGRGSARATPGTIARTA